MFDKLKLLCMIATMYVQMNIENARSSISQYLYPVSIEQSWNEVEKREEYYKSLDLSFDQAFIMRLNDATLEDLQEAKGFLLQDYNLYGNIIVQNLELLQSSLAFEKITLSREQLEQTVYLLPEIVTSYEAQRLVVLIVLGMATLLPEDAQLLNDIHTSWLKSMDLHHIFYNFRRERFVDDGNWDFGRNL